jgi:hypothetical protein
MDQELAAAPRRAGPFILEDERDQEDDPEDAVLPIDNVVLPAKGPSPLSELSPNTSLRSPAKQRRNQDDIAHTHDVEPPGKSTSTDDGGGGIAMNHEINEFNENLHDRVSNLVALVASRGMSRTTSGEPPKRKKRPLGRNTSWISNPSASTKSERTSPVRELEKSQSAGANSNADGFNGLRNIQMAPPGTQLGYDTEDVDESHRRQMNEKFGCSVLDHAPAGMRVASVGTVKDNDFTSSKGARVVRRARQRK